MASGFGGMNGDEEGNPIRQNTRNRNIQEILTGAEGRSTGRGQGETGGSGHPRGAEFVTRDDLAIEMNRLQANIQAMFDHIRPAATEIPDTFSAAVDAAENVERDKGRDANAKSLGKRKLEEMTYDSEEYKSLGFDSHPSFRTIERPCPKCNRFHQGNCYNSRNCYRCGKTGHIVKDCHITRFCFFCHSPNHIQYECPQWKAHQGSRTVGSMDVRPGEMQKPEVPKARGRSFQRTAKEAEETPDAVTGKIFINSIRAKVLIDSGVNQLFVSLSFAAYVYLKPKVLDHALMVDTTNDSQVSVKGGFLGS